MSVRFSAELVGVNKVVAELEKLQKSQTQLKEKLRAVGEESARAGQKTTRAIRDMQRYADRVVKSVQTPVARFREELAKLDAAAKQNTQLALVHTQAMDRLAQKFAATANPMQAYEINLTRLDRQLKTGAINQAQYDRELNRAKQASLGAASGVGRLEIELRDLNRQLDRGQLSQGEYVARLEDIRRTQHDTEEATEDLGSAHEKHGGILTGLAGKVMGLFTAYTTVTGAINLFRQAMEGANEVANQQRDAQMTVAEAQAATILNLGPVPTEEATTFLDAIQGLQERLGLKDARSLFQATSGMLSATGGDQALTRTILEQTAPLFKTRPGELPEFASAVADIASMIKAETPKEIAETIGLVIGVQQKARIVEPSAFKEAAASIAGATAVDTEEDRVRAVIEAGAAFAAIGGAIKDPSGSLTKTAVANMAVQLERMMPEKDILGVGIEGGVTEAKRKELIERQASLRESIQDSKEDLVDAEAEKDERLRRQQKRLAEAKETNLQRSQDQGWRKSRGLAPAKLIDTEAIEYDIAQTQKDYKDQVEREQKRVARATKELAEIESQLTEEPGQTVVRKGTGLRTFAERVAAVQQSPELQRLFFQGGDGLQSASFRGAVKPVIRSFLTDEGSEAAERFQRALGDIKPDPKNYEQILKNLLEASQPLQVAEEAQQLGAGVEAYDLASEGGYKATVRDELERVLKRTAQGLPDVADMSTPLAGPMGRFFRGVDAGGDPAEEAQRELLYRRHNMVFPRFPNPWKARYWSERSVESQMEALTSGQFDEAERQRGLSKDQQAQLELIDDTLQTLESIKQKRAAASTTTAVEPAEAKEGINLGGTAMGGVATAGIAGLASQVIGSFFGSDEEEPAKKSLEVPEPVVKQVDESTTIGVTSADTVQIDARKVVIDGPIETTSAAQPVAPPPPAVTEKPATPPEPPKPIEKSPQERAAESFAEAANATAAKDAMYDRTFAKVAGEEVPAAPAGGFTDVLPSFDPASVLPSADAIQQIVDEKPTPPGEGTAQERAAAASARFREATEQADAAREASFQQMADEAAAASEISLSAPDEGIQAPTPKPPGQLPSRPMEGIDAISPVEETFDPEAIRQYQLGMARKAFDQAAAAKERVRGLRKKPDTFRESIANSVAQEASQEASRTIDLGPSGDSGPQSEANRKIADKLRGNLGGSVPSSQAAARQRAIDAAKRARRVHHGGRLPLGDVESLASVERDLQQQLGEQASGIQLPDLNQLTEVLEQIAQNTSRGAEANERMLDETIFSPNAGATAVAATTMGGHSQPR